MQLLLKINTVVALCKIAFDACLNFYKQDFVIKNKRANLLTQILEEYNLLYRIEKKIMYVDLITAKGASEELKNVIIKRLGQEKKILLNEIVDKSVLGGVLIKVNDKQFDSTVKNRINKIKSSFKV